MNTIYTTRLQTHIPTVKQLHLSIDWWRKCYAEAGLQSDLAWKMYSKAIDDNQPKALIDDLHETARMFDDIRMDAWKELDTAKAQLLALSN